MHRPAAKATAETPSTTATTPPTPQQQQQQLFQLHLFISTNTPQLLPLLLLLPLRQNLLHKLRELLLILRRILPVMIHVRGITPLVAVRLTARRLLLLHEPFNNPRLDQHVCLAVQKQLGAGWGLLQPRLLHTHQRVTDEWEPEVAFNDGCGGLDEPGELVFDIVCWATQRSSYQRTR
jgi:hypothetical protein